MSGAISAIVRALVAAKATPEMILAAVEAAEQTATDALAQRRASDAARQAAKRERTKQDHVTSRDVTVTAPSRAGVSRAEPETTLSEENTSKEERKHSPSARRASAKHLIPDDFVPNEVTFAKAAGRGLSRAEVLEKVEALREWSHGKGEKRADWDAVIQGALRRDATPKPGTGPPRKGPSFLDIANATDRYLKETAADARQPPYLRLAQ